MQSREKGLYKLLANPVLVLLLWLPQGQTPRESKEERVVMARNYFLVWPVVEGISSKSGPSGTKSRF